MSKTKVYDMKVLTDEQCEFETKELRKFIKREEDVMLSNRREQKLR